VRHPDGQRLPVNRLEAAGFQPVQWPGPGSRWVLVRSFGALHAMVSLPSTQDTARALLGVGARGQNISWRPWSIPMGYGSLEVVAGVLSFARVLDRWA